MSRMDVSVVIPTCNRIAMLQKCISSLINQSYPKEKTEIIIVDDSADSDTERIVNDFRLQNSHIKYLSQCRRGPAIARNLGIEASSGEMIAFIDDDCVADKYWLELMIDVHWDSPHIAAVGGNTVVWAQKAPILVSQFLANCSMETCVDGKKEVIFFPTCNVVFKRKIFSRYRFNEKFPFPGGEDLELFWRLFKDGHRFLIDRRIRVVHYRDRSLLSFIKQAYIYGRGNILVQYIHNDHPLLKELRTGRLSFWLSALINIIKIPRFGFILGNRLFMEISDRTTEKRLAIYSYFMLHKIFYILGNISEFLRIKKGKNILILCCFLNYS